MSDRSRGWAERQFLRWSRGVGRWRRPILWLTPVVSLGALLYAARHLGVDTDTSSLISEALDWRRTYREYLRTFPEAEEGLIVVVEARTPALADQAAGRLARELGRDSAAFRSVYQPDGGPFFERYGLYFREADTLAALAERVTRARHLLLHVERDPSSGGLAAALSGALDGAAPTAGDRELDLAPVLGLLAATVFAASEGRFEPLPWSGLMDGRLPTPGERRRTIAVRPRLEFENQVPGREPMTRVRETARRLGLEARDGVTVTLTGSIAIEAEELDSAVTGMRVAGILALISVALILFVGLRSLRLICVSLATLAVGLILTSAFAALAIGHLNLISVAFAVLYVGLGIDYALHLCLRYRARRARGSPTDDAIDRAVVEVGPSLAISALTTAACFYAFTPTDFTGVAELGLIGGTGMLISFAVTVTLLPAALATLPLAEGTPALPDGLPQLGAWVGRRRKTILIVAGASGLAALAALPRASFDENPLNLRDPESESLETYHRLLADPRARPMTVSIVAPDARVASETAERLRGLGEVGGARTIEDFIPSDFEEKKSHLAPLRVLLSPPAAPSAGRGGAAAGERGGADPADAMLSGVTRLEQSLTEARWAGSPDERAAARQAFHALRLWRRGLEGLDAEGRRRHAAELDRVLVGALPDLVHRLRVAADAPPVDYQTLPADLRRRWAGPAGERRVDVLPAGDVGETEALRAFVDAVREIEPGATGAAVSQRETGRVAVAAFRWGLLAAGLVTAASLLVLLGGWRAGALVVGPLALAAVWTGGLVVLLDMPFNFANVIALPLLLGVGVDNGIHMVHHVRRRGSTSGPLAGSTGRAILFASLTTIASFGNLAFAVHVGMATMGRLLTVGMSCVLLATLVVLPAWVMTMGLEGRSAAEQAR